VPADVMHKLREYLRKEGLVQPLVVRRMPDHHQILGGFHRWTICKDELGYTEIPCVVVDVDEKRAKLLTVNLNELERRSRAAPDGALVHDLSRDTSLEDLSTLLPYSEAELLDFEELLKAARRARGLGRGAEIAQGEEGGAHGADLRGRLEAFGLPTAATSR
jgi:ParB-like chromosome segregation protein Spo0J